MSPTCPPPRSAALRAAAVLTACAAALRYLHGLGTAPWAHIDLGAPVAWLLTTPTEDVVAALLRVAALTVCGWVTATLGLALASRLLGWRPALALSDRLSPAFLRRVADRVAGGTLVVASLLGPTAGPALAASPDAPPGATAPFPPPGAVPVAGPGAPAEGAVVVASGDHLWGIAARALAAVRGVPADTITPAEIAPYWRRVVAANRHRLRSGDPDLVWPGETIVLPEIRP